VLEFGLSTEREIRAELGGRLRAQRLAQDLSQADLAERAGIGLATVQRLEARGECTLENFVRVVIGLGLADDLQDLFELQVRSIAEMEQAEKGRRIRASRKAGSAKRGAKNP